MVKRKASSEALVPQEEEDQKTLALRSGADRTARSKLRKKLKASAEYAALPDDNTKEAYLAMHINALMETRDEKGLSLLSVEADIMERQAIEKKAAEEERKKRIHAALNDLAQQVCFPLFSDVYLLITWNIGYYKCF
jgi:hypothetical protein